MDATGERTTDSGVSKDTVVIEKRIDDTLHMEASRKIFKFQISSSKTGKDKEKITALVPSPLIRESMQRKLKKIIRGGKVFRKKCFLPRQNTMQHINILIKSDISI